MRRVPTALILDLRNNQGGEIEYGAFLLSHLIPEQFRVLDGYYQLDPVNPLSLRKTIGDCMGIYKPKVSVFKGSLYVLINGGSFSNSGIVAACLKRYHRAIFIGEESGGNNKVLAGDANEFRLPNSSIRIEIPTKQYMLDEGMDVKGRGTMPDYPVPLRATGEYPQDDAMKFAIEKISVRN